MHILTFITYISIHFIYSRLDGVVHRIITVHQKISSAKILQLSIKRFAGQKHCYCLSKNYLTKRTFDFSLQMSLMQIC